MTRILLVEDEESYRDPLTYQLTREGYEVVAVASGPEGLEAFERGGVDLVLLDVMLPGMSGVEVCRELRRTSSVPVIMLTAKDSEIDKVVGLEIGADDYVTKPYSFRELLARVRAEMATSAKAVKEETAAECARMLKIQGEQGHQLRILHRRIRYARILLWVVLLASGVALGGLVWQQRADFLSFLENLVRSLG